MIQTFQTRPVDELVCVYMRSSVASGVCAFLFWKLHASSTEVFVQRWTGADRRLFESERRGGRERKEHKAHKTMDNCFWRCQTINWRAWLRCLRVREMWPIQRAWRRAGTLSPIRVVVRGVMVFILYFKYNHGLKQCMTACLKAKISVCGVSTARILCEFKWFVFCGQSWIWHLPPGYCDRTTEGIW